MHRFHVHHHHHHTFDDRDRSGRGEGRGRRRRGPRTAGLDGRFDARFDARLDRHLDRVIAALEERQRDLEQAAADLADTVRQLKERQAAYAARVATEPPADAAGTGSTGEAAGPS